MGRGVDVKVGVGRSGVLVGGNAAVGVSDISTGMAVAIIVGSGSFVGVQAVMMLPKTTPNIRISHMLYRWLYRNCLILSGQYLKRLAVTI